MPVLSPGIPILTKKSTTSQANRVLQKAKKLKGKNLSGIDENTFSPTSVLSKASPLMSFKPGLNSSIASTVSISSSPSNSPLVKYWLKDLELEKEDYDILQSSTEWLNDRHINAALNILKKQFQGINGFQSTLSIPRMVNKKWKYDNRLQLTKSPAAQIHHDGVMHWVASITVDGTVYYLDSLSNSITTEVEIQMASMYDPSSGKELEIIIPTNQKQGDGNSCGLFAIANLVEYCFTKSCFWMNTNFYMRRMRDHLTKCFQNRKFTKFPSYPLTNPSRKEINKIHTIAISCPCGLPNVIDNLICCKICGHACHESCIRSKKNKKQDICTNCK